MPALKRRGAHIRTVWKLWGLLLTIVSFSRRFIFVKTKKTAGTSMEVYLARRCSRDDVVTPVKPDIDGHEPRNFRADDGRRRFVNHQSMQTIARELDPEFVRSAFKFCFERHPVDKCVSHYSMLKNSPAHAHPDNPQSWDAYVERADFPIDAPKYVDKGGRLLVDKVYRYEDLDTALSDIAERCGFPVTPFDVRAKSGFRDTIVVSATQRQKIMSAFSATNAMLRYD